MIITPEKVQALVTTQSEVLSAVFQAAIREVRADQGFLAFIDNRDYLSILIAEGKYLHLPCRKGVAGRAFTNNETIISKSSDAAFEGIGGSGPFSEIVVPVRWQDKAVGILLMDNWKHEEFTQHDVEILKKHTQTITDNLGGVDPWSFRAWWSRELKRKQGDLLECVKSHLASRLGAHFSSKAGVRVFIAPVNAYEKIGNYASLIDNFGKEAHVAADPIQEVLETGATFQSHRELKREFALVPFPSKGPIIGIIKIETTNQTLLTEALKHIESDLSQLDDNPLALSGQYTKLIDGNYYINLIIEALSAHIVNENIVDALECVMLNVQRLCGTKVRIYCLKGMIGKVTPGTVVSVSKSTLEKQLAGRHIGNRPRATIGKESIRCPVFELADGSLIAVLTADIDQDEYAVADEYNHQVLERIAELISHIFINFRMKQALETSGGVDPKKCATKVLRDRPAPAEDILDAFEWLMSLEAFSLEKFRVVGNFVVADREHRDMLKTKLAGLLSSFEKGERPYPVLLCGRPGSGKSFFVSEVAREVGITNPGESIQRCNLADSENIGSTLGGHFKHILTTAPPRVAFLDEFDTTVKGENAYRFLLDALQGDPVDLGDDVKKTLGQVLWFFAASQAPDVATFEKNVADKERGPDCLRRFYSSGKILELPGLFSRREIAVQAAATAHGLRKSLQAIEASVLFYFACSEWKDAGHLVGAVREVLESVDQSQILGRGGIARRPDFYAFTEEYIDMIKKLGDRLVTINQKNT